MAGFSRDGHFRLIQGSDWIMLTHSRLVPRVKPRLYWLCAQSHWASFINGTYGRKLCVRPFSRKASIYQSVYECTIWSNFMSDVVSFCQLYIRKKKSVHSHFHTRIGIYQFGCDRVIRSALTSGISFCTQSHSKFVVQHDKICKKVAYFFLRNSWLVCFWCIYYCFADLISFF